MIWAKLHCPPKIFWAGTAMFLGEVEQNYDSENLCIKFEQNYFDPLRKSFGLVRLWPRFTNHVLNLHAYQKWTEKNFF